MYDHLFIALLAIYGTDGASVERRAGIELAAAGYASEGRDGRFAITPDGAKATEEEIRDMARRVYGAQAAIVDGPGGAGGGVVYLFADDGLPREWFWEERNAFSPAREHAWCRLANALRGEIATA